jgi:hypothetical protein
MRRDGALPHKTKRKTLVQRVRDMMRRALFEIVTARREVVRELTDSYRPELHYMRGPGPKWIAKHGRS